MESPKSFAIGSEPESVVPGIVDQRLSVEMFSQLCGVLAGIPFVKVVVDRAPGKTPVIHFINQHRYKFHSDYIAERLLGMRPEELDRNIDEFNKSVYLSADRRFYLGLVALYKQGDRFFTLETVEIDNMDAEMVKFFYRTVKAHLDMDIAVLFKPANHIQERIAASLSSSELPRVFSHELFASANFIALNTGTARGRLRVFRTEAEFREARSKLEWFDIIVMNRVPDDIPRLAGIINAQHTTPLSHTNVLASGWQIPNAVEIGIIERIQEEQLDGQWVTYTVDPNEPSVLLTRSELPAQLQRPAWMVQRIKLEEPETVNTPIAELDSLRMSDRYRYGTKAANLGELRHVLERGSERLLGFYKIKRPPRPNLLPYLAERLGLPATSDAPRLVKASSEFLQKTVLIPRGIALPFSVQQEFLESSPRIQQTIGKMKMALELNAPEIDAICLTLQALIRNTRMPVRLRDYIDSQIANHLAGVSSFVVRSSSNAEDLDNFSAAGIYESINHVTTAQNIFESIKEVWASLVSPRSVRLRHEVGISADDSYMGVIIQEELQGELGGVMVTTNPLNRADFRNVYINVSRSVQKVVHGGAEQPFQYLYNTVEGGGRTLSIGEAEQDLPEERRAMLERLAFAGRLLQSHFSPDYTFSVPLDIEWLINDEGIHLLQLRPYSK